MPGDAGAVKYIYCIFSGGKFKRWENIGEELRPIEAGRTDRYLKVTEDQLDVVSQSQRADRIKNMNKSPSRTYGVVTSAESRSYKARQFAEWSKKTMADLQVNSKDSVIIVSYFLPVILKKKDGHWAATWDKENVLSLQLDLRLIWVGSIRYANAPIPMEEEDAVARVLADMNCYPVFINQNMHYQFYDIFCKQNLWLVLHHIVDVYGPMSKSESTSKSQQNLWFSYSTVHKLFRDKVLEVFQESYLVWIHGFHLMLLPTFLRRRISTAKIGYYFHTPFPSSEIWRSMARREDLIRGILGADQIGFHLYEYARHFLTTCRRLLGCSYEMKPNGNMTITIDGREVVITCIHIGVDLPRCDEILFNQTFEQEVQQWKNRFSNKIIISGKLCVAVITRLLCSWKIFSLNCFRVVLLTMQYEVINICCNVGIDRLERIKGIPLKLLAVEQFMTDNPQWIGKVVFILVGITAGERGTDYWLTLNDVQVSIERLNNTFSVANDNSGYNKLIYFEERHDRDIRLAQRLPLFAATDVLMITATR